MIPRHHTRRGDHLVGREDPGSHTRVIGNDEREVEPHRRGRLHSGRNGTRPKAAGEGPCIHHFAIEVEDLRKATEEVKSWGCDIISDPGVIPVKFRAPGGTVAELVPIGRYKKPERPAAK